MPRRRFSGLSKRLFGLKHSGQRNNKHGSVLRDAVFARRLRCEPLEDRRMLAVLMVDADAAPGGDGLAWGSAYNDLQGALSQAAVLNVDGDTLNDIDQIWIAEGSYTPSDELEPSDARSASFSHRRRCITMWRLRGHGNHARRARLVNQHHHAIRRPRHA